MTWPTLFGLTNLIAMLGWAALAFLPRRPAVLSLVLYGGVAMLCAAYLAMFVALVGNLVDPVRVAGTRVRHDRTGTFFTCAGCAPDRRGSRGL